MVNPYEVLVEGLIFSVGRIGIDYKLILEKVPVLTKDDLKEIIEDLKRKYPNDGTSGVVLCDYGKKLSFATYAGIGEQVAEALVRTKQKELSNALLEVLSVVAYQQPVTKAEIEQVREGKNCDYAIGALMDAGLIEVVGRKDVAGRPMLYGTTQVFLEKFELQSLKKLPSHKEIEERIKIIRTEAINNEMLFVDSGDEFASSPDEQAASADDDLDEGAPVGAGEQADYDDTDYDEVAADQTDDTDYDVSDDFPEDEQIEGDLE